MCGLADVQIKGRRLAKHVHHSMLFVYGNVYWSVPCGNYALSLELYERCGSKSPWPVLDFKQGFQCLFSQCIDNIRCNGLMTIVFEENSKVTVPHMIK